MKPSFPIAAGLAALAVLWSCQRPNADQQYRATHHALFETYVPSAADTELQTVESESFAKLAAVPGIRKLWDGLDQAVVLHTWLRYWHFSDVPKTERWVLLDAMLQESPGPFSQVSNTLRLVYLNTAYGSAWGNRLSQNGARLSPKAPPVFALPNLPATHVAYDAASQTVGYGDGTTVPFDDLVIGSGPAGAVIAYELAVVGHHKVLLVDRGSFVLPTAVNTRASGALEESSGTRLSDDGAISFANGNTVGGGSAVNLDLAFSPLLPSVQKQLQFWRDTGRIAADRFSLPEVTRAYAWVESMVGTRPLDASVINANNQTLWEGSKAIGMTPSLYHLNTYTPEQAKNFASDKRSATQQLILPALQAGAPLSVLSDADVTKVLFDGDAAVGAEFIFRKPWASPGVLDDLNDLKKQGLAIGGKARILAKRVIVSAGTLGSATILLRSGLRNDQLGRGIVIHPAIPVIGVFDRPIRSWEGLTTSVYLDQFALDKRFILEAMTAPQEYAAVMVPGTPDQVLDVVRHYPNLAGFGPMIIDESSPDNRIYLDAEGNPQIHYVLTPADRAKAGPALATAVRIMLASGAKKVFVPSFDKTLREHLTEGLYFTSPEQAALLEKQLKALPNLLQMTSAHLQGSVKMGLSPSDSVVSSQDFHVWGKDHLYVMDSSVFPTSVGANPMQSIYTLAKIFSDQLLTQQSN